MVHAPPEMLGTILLAAAAVVLATAFAPLRSILAQLPAGAVRRKWYWHAAFIAVLIAGCAAYMAWTFGTHTSWPALLAPALALALAVFVQRGVTLALHSAAELRRLGIAEQDAISDSLTGAYSHRYLTRRLEEEFQRARRYQQPLSVLLLDIDHLAQLVGRQGRRSGDALLQEMAALCQATIRSSDLVARYVADELVVITPNTTPAQALVLAERLRRAAEAQELPLADEQGGVRELRATVSIGVTAYGPGTASSQALLLAADKALHRARLDGGNRVKLELGPRLAELQPQDARAATSQPVAA